MTLPTILLATFLVYLPALSFAFVYDDKELILKNPRVQSWAYFPGYFTHNLWAHLPGDTSPFYRPLFLVWMRVNYAVFGSTSPWGWHAANIFVHVLVTALLFLVVRKLAQDRILAAVTAAIFGLHPVHMENVAWICGVPDPLMAAGILLSVLSYLYWQDRGSKPYLVASLLFYVSAILVKEPAVVVLPVVTLLAWWRRKQTRLSLTLFPFGFATVIYLVVRHLVLPVQTASATTPLFNVAVTSPGVLAHYAKAMIVPFGLSAFYDSSIATRMTIMNFALPLAVLIVGVLATSFLVKNLGQHSLKEVGTIAAVLLVVPILPVLNPNNLVSYDFVHDRYLYVSSLGFAMLVALALRRFASVRFAVAAAGILAITLGILTVTQEGMWRDEITLYSDGLARAPRNIALRNNLGSALMAAHRCDEAIPLLEQVVTQDQSNWKAYANMANCYGQQGNTQTAISLLERAAAINPDPILMRQLQWARTLPRSPSK